MATNSRLCGRRFRSGRHVWHRTDPYFAFTYKPVERWNGKPARPTKFTWDFDLDKERRTEGNQDCPNAASKSPLCDRDKTNDPDSTRGVCARLPRQR